jgi:hypothetical protein
MTVKFSQWSSKALRLQGFAIGAISAVAAT